MNKNKNMFKQIIKFIENIFLIDFENTNWTISQKEIDEQLFKS